MSKLTAVQFLADKFNYITWMRNRDEISAGTADEWRANFLKQAMEMEKGQIIDAYNSGQQIPPFEYAEQYYNETYKTTQP